MKKKFVLLSVMFVVIISMFTFCFVCDKAFATNSNTKVEDIFGKGCEVGPLNESKNGFSQAYCKNKNYVFIKKGFVSIDLYPGYEFYDCKNPDKCYPIGFIRYDYNFNRYYCSYKWDQRNIYCNMEQFIMEMKKYLRM